MKNKLFATILILFVLFSFGCKTNEGDLYIECEDTVEIQKSIDVCVVFHEEKLNHDEVLWTLSDYGSAEINEGVLYAKDYGVIVITAVLKDDNTNYCSKSITVIPPRVEDIQVSGPTEVQIDKSIKLQALVLPEIIEDEVIWESSNIGIINVDELGNVYGVGVGTAKVIVKCNEFSKEIEIKVNPAPEATDIIVTGATTVEVNKNIQLEATVVPAEVEYKIYWSSENTNIFTIDQTGYITGVSEGTANVILKCGQFEKKISITVTPKPKAEDIIVKGKQKVYIGNTLQLTAEVIPSIVESEFVWASSNTNILNVTPNGKVIPIMVGEANVIVKCDGIEKSYPIIVEEYPTSIEIYGDSNIKVNEFKFYEFNIEEKVVLYSSDPSIAEVANNSLLGKKEGKITLTAYKADDNQLVGTMEITIEGEKQTIETSQEEVNIINEMLDKLTLEQKIGQMFNLGFTSRYSSWSGQYDVQIDPSTGLPFAQFGSEGQGRSVLELIKDYKFGNFTITDFSGGSIENIQKSVKTLKDIGFANSGINPMISIYANGGETLGALSGIPTNNLMSSIDDFNAVKGLNDLYSEKISLLGINAVINNYMNNATSGAMFGNSVTENIVYSSMISNIYKENNVLLVGGSSKYDYWSDSRSLEELLESDFMSMKLAAINGDTIISVPSTCYLYNNENFCVTTDEFMKDMLRRQVGFNGVAFMDANATQLLLYQDAFVEYMILAINQGVDMFGFNIEFTSRGWGGSGLENFEKVLNLYNGLIDSVNNGTVSEERINEAVFRILLSKYKTGILESKFDEEYDFTEINDKISDFLPSFITVIGNMGNLPSGKTAMIVSLPATSTGTSQSLGEKILAKYEIDGKEDISIYHTNTLIIETIQQKAREVDYVYVCAANINPSSTIGYGGNKNFIEEVQKLKNINPNICIILTNSLSVKYNFDFIDNFICLNSCYEDDFSSLYKVLSGKATPNYK